MNLTYNDCATFVEVKSSGYSKNKIPIMHEDVPVIFLQNTGMNRTNYQDGVIADAICFVDPENDFILAKHYRLEGFYVLDPLFDISEEEAWYKVVSVAINRDHLLENEINNIELRLKKAQRVPNVS